MAFTRWLTPLALAALLPGLASAGRQGPARPAVEAWLGVFEAGPERVALVWTDEGLRLELGQVAVPVDGQWHETVPTFFVRHRATWVATRHVIEVEEQHNLGALWRFELRHEVSGRRLLKVAPAAGGNPERVLRTLLRVR
ncbi:MAG: hypothetical protein AB1635_05365 [Acidobacteriota bacterium]